MVVLPPLHTAMQTKDLARATGVDAQTIRYYEAQGLLAPPARLANGYRHYNANHLERLAFIRHCRALDMPLADVRTLLGYLDDPDTHCASTSDLIDEQLDRVRAWLHSMQALEQQLVQLRARCNDPQDRSHCGIMADMVAAAHGEACACHPAGAESHGTAGAHPADQRCHVSPRR